MLREAAIKPNPPLKRPTVGAGHSKLSGQRLGRHLVAADRREAEDNTSGAAVSCSPYGLGALAAGGGQGATGRGFFIAAVGVATASSPSLPIGLVASRSSLALAAKAPFTARVGCQRKTIGRLAGPKGERSEQDHGSRVAADGATRAADPQLMGPSGPGNPVLSDTPWHRTLGASPLGQGPSQSRKEGELREPRPANVLRFGLGSDYKEPGSQARRIVLSLPAVGCNKVPAKPLAAELAASLQRVALQTGTQLLKAT